MTYELPSVRMWRQHKRVQAMLHQRPVRVPDNPLWLIDPVSWSQNFYVEDRFSLAGQHLGPGPIILTDMQSRIIRACTQQYIVTDRLVNENIRSTGCCCCYLYIYIYKASNNNHNHESNKCSHDLPLILRLNSDHPVYNSSPVLLIPEATCCSATCSPLSACCILTCSIIAALAGDRITSDIEIPLDCTDWHDICDTLHIDHDLLIKLVNDLIGDRSPVDVLADVLRTSTRYRWATIVYSAVKKSGKTRISALVASHLAYRSIPFSEIYCLANDGKQSSDRVLSAVKKSITLATVDRKSGGNGGVMADWEQVALEVRLSDNQFIQAIPVDPEGEAGSQPTGTFWSEMWGFKLGIKEKLWTELTIPPTRWGRAIRWVESYAGYVGESNVLWNLYTTGVDAEEHPEGKGVRHPDFPDLPVYINERAKQITYWDHEPRMPWQTPEYYAAEAEILSDDEFNKVHRNIWVSPLQQAIPIARWDALSEQLPPIRDGELLVLSVDLSVSGDGTALVAVSRHPTRNNKWAIRSAQLWTAPPGQKILYQNTIMPAIREFCLDERGDTNLNVLCIVYDEYQAHLLATDMQEELGIWFDTFSQGKGTPIKPGRPVADKMFFDLVMAGRIAHGGDPVFRQHVNNAAGSTTTDGKYLRFVKKTDAADCRIDLLVAASMAICTISRLNV